MAGELVVAEIKGVRAASASQRPLIGRAASLLVASATVKAASAGLAWVPAGSSSPSSCSRSQRVVAPRHSRDSSERWLQSGSTPSLAALALGACACTRRERSGLRRAASSRPAIEEDEEIAAVDAAIASLMASSSVRVKDWGRRVATTELEIGQKLTGIVHSIRNFGFFVDVGADREGLVHISRIDADRYIRDLHEEVQPGQKVTVWVSNVEGDGKLSLSMLPLRVRRPPGSGKQDVSAFSSISPKEWLTGTVDSAADFGVLVTLPIPGREQEGKSAMVTGLVHVTDVRGEVTVGQQVAVRVVRVDAASGQLYLSMQGDERAFMEATPSRRRTGSRPSDVAAFRNVPKDQWLDGTVTHTTTFGAFLTVRHPSQDVSAKVLVHVNNMRDYAVEDPAVEVEIGEEVKVRLLAVDVPSGRIAGSMLDPNARC